MIVSLTRAANGLGSCYDFSANFVDGVFDWAEYSSSFWVSDKPVYFCLVNDAYSNAADNAAYYTWMGAEKVAHYYLLPKIFNDVFTSPKAADAADTQTGYRYSGISGMIYNRMHWLKNIAGRLLRGQVLSHLLNHYALKEYFWDYVKPAAESAMRPFYLRIIPYVARLFEYWDLEISARGMFVYGGGGTIPSYFASWVTGLWRWFARMTLGRDETIPEKVSQNVFWASVYCAEKLENSFHYVMERLDVTAQIGPCIDSVREGDYTCIGNMMVAPYHFATEMAEGIDSYLLDMAEYIDDSTSLPVSAHTAHVLLRTLTLSMSAVIGSKLMWDVANYGVKVSGAWINSFFMPTPAQNVHLGGDIGGSPVVFSVNGGGASGQQHQQVVVHASPTNTHNNTAEVSDKRAIHGVPVEQRSQLRG